jgi:hypothetical protein
MLTLLMIEPTPVPAKLAGGELCARCHARSGCSNQTDKVWLRCGNYDNFTEVNGMQSLRLNGKLQLNLKK